MFLQLNADRPLHNLASRKPDPFASWMRPASMATGIPESRRSAITFQRSGISPMAA